MSKNKGKREGKYGGKVGKEKESGVRKGELVMAVEKIIHEENQILTPAVV